MAKSYRERIGELLELVQKPLAAYGIDRLKARYGEDWRQGAFDALGDRRHGHTADDPREWDIQAWLNFYIGSWSGFFAEVLSPADRSRVFELKEFRNQWAHMGNFDFDKTYRAYDYGQLFLESINSPVSEKVAAVKEELQREKFSKPTKKAVVRIKTNPQGALKPWRSVAVPHEDVQKGTYSSSEFAADLWEVYKATIGDPGAHVSDEYRDPRTFFGRTYVTEGLGALLRAGLKRLNGQGGEPVVQLQTNFGGGKTHSMLALYHLMSGISPQDLSGVDEFLVRENLSVPKGVRRAVIVGNKIEPGSVTRKNDGTEVRTLWGEIAWQLGGKTGYEMVRSADEQATNPGDALTALLKRFAPAVILIDEWVAYARQLYNRQDLKACGSFDTQFTFAQTLTEAAKIAGGVVLVVSLPESKTELGSEAGEETLDRLRTVVGRVESTWQPATRTEAFEIVRRRLFKDAMDTNAVAETVRAFQELYRNNPDHFPPRVREGEYLQHLKHTYPIHPDLFDSLYKTWSVIPGFQQTRGVLRLMAAVIHSLWDGGDTGLMIMPGMVPLDDSSVRTEFTKFLGTGWNNIIDSEIDGSDSIAAQVDRENSALGELGAARRAARTLFLATSPLGKSSNPGIDRRAMKTGCVQPGEKPAAFGDAAGYLSARSVHLYSEDDRFWYSEQPTLRRLAEDRKAAMEREDLLASLEETLRKPPHQERGDFARLHVAPRSPGDVADEDRVALVVLPPGEIHTRGDDQSAARAMARSILDSRGAAPRINKNMVVFVAADAVRLEELLDAVGWVKSWSGIIHQIDQGHPSMSGVTRGQAESARAELERARSLVQARVPETYRWMLLPSQRDPGKPIEIAEHQITGDRPVGLKATQFLANKQWLMAQMDGPALKVEMDHVPLWGNGGYVSVAALCEYFARHPYLPRVASRETVLEAIRDGVASLTWNPQTFAWAEGFDEATGRFLKLTAGEQPDRTILDGGIVVKPDIAQEQLDQEARERKEIEQREGEHGVPVSAGDQPPNVPEIEGGGPQPLPFQATELPKKRFFGSVKLDPHRASTQMGTILEEVIGHLNAAGAQVEVSLEIESRLPAGFSDQVRRVVSQNATDLKFDQVGFEEE
jgi:hypothetical protein